MTSLSEQIADTLMETHLSYIKRLEVYIDVAKEMTPKNRDDAIKMLEDDLATCAKIVAEIDL